MGEYVLADRLLKSLHASAVAAGVGTVLWQQMDFVLLVLNMMDLPRGTTPSEVLEGWLLMLSNLGGYLTMFAGILCVTVAAAMPLQALLQRFGRTDFVTLALMGAALGAVFFQVMTAFLMRFDAEPELAPLWRIRHAWAVAGAVIGLIMGAVGWLIRRPDRDGVADQKISGAR